MAEIYAKASEKMLILAPREGFYRQFNFGTDWTQIRMGIFWSGVAATGPNDAGVSESATIVSNADRMNFGLKDNSPTLPGQAGSLFIGVEGAASTVESSTGSDGQVGPNSNSWRARGWDGTSGVTGGNISITNARAGTQSVTSSNYAGYIVMRIDIVDRGLSTQNLVIRLEGNYEDAGVDYTETLLRTRMLGMNPGGTTSLIDWNDTVVAKTIPDTFWVRCPLYLNQIRLHCIRAIRVI